MQPAAARSIIAAALGPLPGCPKADDPCRAGTYPHCLRCDTAERAAARCVDRLLGLHSAAVGRAHAAGVDVAEVTFSVGADRGDAGALLQARR